MAPVSTVQDVPPQYEADAEKQKATALTSDDTPHDLKEESDSNSSNVQEGIKRVDAIASVWSPKMLWITLCL
jgi:hypothetical protein